MRLTMRNAIFSGTRQRNNAKKFAEWCRVMDGDAELVFETEPSTSDGSYRGGPRVRVIYVVPPDMDGTDAVIDAVKRLDGYYVTRPDVIYDPPIGIPWPYDPP